MYSTLRSGNAWTARGSGHQIHNLYSACEQLLELVARAFENQIEGARCHVDLLRRMKGEIRGVRPALLTEGLADRLRGFRHLFRHAYDADLNPDRIAELAKLALELRRPLQTALDRFLQELTGESGS